VSGGYAAHMADTGAGWRPPFELLSDDSSRVVAPVLATAIHAGHDLRPEVASLSALPPAARAREEDPFTDRIIAGTSARAIAHRSRFEVDLNRPRDEAVYREGDDTWGQEPWAAPLPREVVERSLRIYDAFYDALGARLDRMAEQSPFAVLDVHSYNHRRGGPGAPAAPDDENPEVNLGTGSLDTDRWGPVVGALAGHLRATRVGDHALDVRENVRFAGGHLARWVNERYAGRGGAVAIEFKKVFMDEWSGAVDDSHLARLRDALTAAVDPVAGALAQVRAGARARA
jgi:N-formylglutamate amidohydrolase